MKKQDAQHQHKGKHPSQIGCLVPDGFGGSFLLNAVLWVLRTIECLGVGVAWRQDESHKWTWMWMHVHFVGKILEFACPAAAQILQSLQIAAARRRGARQTKLDLLGDDCNSRGFPTHKSTAPSCTNHGRIIDFALVYQRFHVDFGSMRPRCNRWCSSYFIG